MNEHQRKMARKAGGACGYAQGGHVSHRDGSGTARRYEDGGPVTAMGKFQRSLSNVIESGARAVGARGSKNIDRANAEQEPQNRIRSRRDASEAIEEQRESPVRRASGVNPVDRAEDAALAPVEGKKDGGFIKGAIKHPGREKRAAARAGMSTHGYMEKHAGDSGSAGDAARLGLRLEKMRK